MILREARDAPSRQTGALAVVLHLAVLDEAGAAEPIAEPQAAARSRKQRHDVAGEQAFAADSVDALEAHAIEAEESPGGRQPEIAVARLRERLQPGRRSILRRPRRVMELRNAKIRR